MRPCDSGTVGEQAGTVRAIVLRTIHFKKDDRKINIKEKINESRRFTGV